MTSFAKWFYDKLRDYRHVSWHLNSRSENIRNGEQAAEFLLAHPASEDGSSEAVAAGGSEQHAVVLPPELEEIRQAYESKAVDFVDSFRRDATKVFCDLDVCAEKGHANIGLLRHDLFSYLKSYAWQQHYKTLVWTLFVCGLFILSLLDMAPTLLVFEALMDNDTVSIGALFGVSDSLMRNILLGASTFAFLVAIVLIGHVVAKLVAATYLDGEIPWIGIVLAFFVISMFFSVAMIRYNHEAKSTYESYSSYIKKFERDKLSGITAAGKPLTMEEWQPGNQIRTFFNSVIFVLISASIFIIAIYLSLWRMYGDLRMITRRFKHIRYRVRCAKLSASLRVKHNVLINRWERLRQSAQVEVEQFLMGVELAMRKQPEKFAGTEWRVQQNMSAIRKQFSEKLALPQAYDKTEKVLLPDSEEGWGRRYVEFMTETAWYDAFSKGAMDAVNHCESNPGAAVNAISKHNACNDLLIGVSPESMKDNYENGFREGAQVPYGASWAKSNNSSQQ